MVYRPWLSDVVERCTPVSEFTMVMAAFGITDPLGSVTVPLSDVVWPKTLAASKTKSAVRHRLAHVVSLSPAAVNDEVNADRTTNPWKT